MKGVIMKRTQQGLTLVSFVIVLVIVCFFGYMAMVLGPAYSEYYGVAKAVNFVAAGATPSQTDVVPLQKALDRQFNIGYVESVMGKDAKLIREKTGNILSMEYEVRKGFMYNIDFVLKFKHQAPLGSKTAGD